ncbi:MAG: carboxymuconolactone decarboxylase family protein [Chloroflexi bacterium]|nr:carboxymuconolactone decarboxylase family protein [Chloroflexota bacterium]
MSDDIERRLGERSAATLGQPPPDLYRLLARQAPWALDGYLKMREAALREPAEGGALPRKYKHLILVAMHVAEKNRWGAATYAAAAIRDGATLEQVAEIVAMTMMTNGQAGYQTAGQYALAAAVEATGERHDG